MTTEAIQRIIEKYFPAEYSEREKNYEEELAELARYVTKLSLIFNSVMDLLTLSLQTSTMNTLVPVLKSIH